MLMKYVSNGIFFNIFEIYFKCGEYYLKIIFSLENCSLLNKILLIFLNVDNIWYIWKEIFILKKISYKKTIFYDDIHFISFDSYIFLQNDFYHMVQIM